MRFDLCRKINYNLEKGAQSRADTQKIFLGAHSLERERPRFFEKTAAPRAAAKKIFSERCGRRLKKLGKSFAASTFKSRHFWEKGRLLELERKK